MVDFRKSFLLLALLIAVSAVASAQPFQCFVNAGVPPIARSEGLAEEVGQVVLQCTGGTPTAAGAPVPTVNVQIFLNTNVTSRLLTSDGWSEALLLLDEPTPAEQTICGATTTGFNPATGTCPMVGTGGVSNIYKAAGAPNIWQGRVTGVNTVSFLGVPLDPPGSAATRTLRIVNVRANANQLGLSSSLLPTPIQMFVSISGTGAPGLSNPTQTVAVIQRGLTFSLRTADGSADVNATTGVTLNQCDGANTTAPGTARGCWNFRARFAENFGTAFRPNTSGSQNMPGTIYNTESMFTNTAFPDLSGIGRGNLANAGFATQPTQLQLRLNNVPTGARVFVTSSNIAPSATVSTSASDITATRTSTSGLATGTTAGTCAGFNGAVNVGYAEITLSSGSGSATFNVTAADPGVISYAEFGVIVSFQPSAVSLGTATANGNYAPISTVTTASTSASVPRFADVATNLNAFTINPCRTNLLFPFVTNQGGFDTGLAISNTSRSPFSADQTGPCTLNYYGNTPGGGAAPAPQTSGAVPAGGHLVATLSGGGTLGLVATPGFQGYIIAQCNFQYAHGFAFISDLGAARLAEGYLALVMDAGLPSRTGATSEVLAH